MYTTKYVQRERERSGPGETRKLSFRSYIIEYRLLTLAKTDAENFPYLPAPLRLIVASWLFVFVAN